MTLEIGARGLVGSRTYRSFVNLGVPVPKTKKLCKVLSVVAARCSYAVYLAQRYCVDDKTDACVRLPKSRAPVVNNIVYLREKGIDRFYHFTDVANLESIREHGLMSA